MFSLPNQNNGCFVDPLLSLPFVSDVNTSSLSKYEQDHLFLPFSSFSIPSSPFYLYQDQDSAAFLQTLMDNITTDATTDVIERSQKDKQVLPKKRSAKTDRHSKIDTAQGPRDRRVRLSLQVARKFFDLQDMLEFDKPSKTVEWLLKQSKSAIEELSGSLKKLNGNGSPCSSEWDVVSGVFDESMDASNNSSALIDDSCKVPELPAKNEKRIWTRTQKSRGMVARESRKQARARAKERTIEKMRIRKLSSNVSNSSASEETGTNQTVEIVEDAGYSYMMRPSTIEEVGQLDEPKEQILGNSYSFTETYIQHNGISQEHPFRDFQMLQKPWEVAYSNSTHLC